MWVANYSDGKLFQFNSDGSENLFSDIDFSKLIFFELNCGFTSVVVNLVTKVCLVNGIAVSISEELENPRLIYFRRSRHTLGRASKIIYFVGIQGNVGNKNSKILISIDEDNNLVSVEYS